MTAYGLLIDYEFCTNCGSCQVTCKEEHNYPVGKWGIRVFDDGPWQKVDGVDAGQNFNWNKIPVPTDLCDFCESRVAEGRKPTCVHHCMASCMQFGTIEEMTAEFFKKPKQVLWRPR